QISLSARRFLCVIKSSASGQPSAQKALLGHTSGFSLKPCLPDPLPCLPQVYHDVNFPGADFRSLFTADYEECQRACTSDPACHFFTFLKPTFPTSNIRYKCHLKYRFSTPGITRRGSITSGFSHRVHTTRNYNTACEGKLFPNTDIAMHSINVQPAASPEHCQALCSAHPLCTSFTYISIDQQHLILCPSLLTEWLKKTYKGIDFPHNDIRNFAEDNFETCQRTCTEDPNCQYFSYVANTPPARYSMPYDPEGFYNNTLLQTHTSYPVQITLFVQTENCAKFRLRVITIS
ncbi:Coagulation factor XI, partial [Nibea albiflora]